MRTLLVALLLVTAAHAHAKKEMARVKLSTVVVTPTHGLAGTIADHAALQAKAHTDAYAQLQAEAARVLATFTGVAEHRLVLDAVTHGVKWKTTTKSAGFHDKRDTNQRERFATTRMSGHLVVYEEGNP